MKILSIIDINLIKLYLNKFFLAHNLEYMFILPQKDSLKKHIPIFKPDLILIQSNYYNYAPEEVISFIREFSDIPVVIFSFSENKQELPLLHKVTDIFYNVSIIEKTHFTENFEKLLKLPDIDEKTKEKRNKRSLLFVDDSQLMHHFMRKIAHEKGLNLITAFDGKEGLNLYKKHLPNMVISDIEMPKMSGLELCKKIKEGNDGRFIPVIILSSRARPIDIDTAFNYGADDYLTKPVTDEELSSKIDEYFSTFEHKKRNKVLVVDDSKVSVEIITHALLKGGLNVLNASSGEEAYDKAVKHSPEVIITDIEMPGMNGYELAEKIRNNPSLRDSSVIMMSSRGKRSDIKKGEKLGVARYFTKPFDVEKMVIVVEQLLLEKYNIYKKEYEYMLSTINSLITALEARDEYTKGHTYRVSRYSLALGKQIGLPAVSLAQLEIAANLHDVGKIGVRDDILLKQGSLSDLEYAKIQEHAIIGAEILKPLRSLEEIIPLILFHHERWDGHGYPSMIKGTQIPIGARIIAIADTFDAMTSDRPYRKALQREAALGIIKEELGAQFCPTCGTAFLDMMLSSETSQIFE